MLTAPIRSVIALAREDRPPAPRVALVCAAAFVSINASFYFLSNGYFESHRQIIGGASVHVYTPELAMHVRLTFVLFSGVIAAALFAAFLWPRIVGHGLPVVLAIGHLAAAVAAFLYGAPAVVGVTMLVSGALMPWLAWRSYHGARAPWTFLIAMCVAFAAITFFGSPKVRGALDVGLWTALIVPGLNVVSVLALYLRRGDYVERDMVTA